MYQSVGWLNAVLVVVLILNIGVMCVFVCVCVCLQVDRKVVASDWKKKWDVLQTKMQEESKSLPPGFSGQITGALENVSQCAGL